MSSEKIKKKEHYFSVKRATCYMVVSLVFLFLDSVIFIKSISCTNSIVPVLRSLKDFLKEDGVGTITFFFFFTFASYYSVQYPFLWK